MAGVAVGDEGVAGAGLESEVEEVGGVAFVEDEEGLGEVRGGLGGLEEDDLIDAGFEEGEVFGGHGWGGAKARSGSSAARRMPKFWVVLDFSIGGQTAVRWRL